MAILTLPVSKAFAAVPRSSDRTTRLSAKMLLFASASASPPAASTSVWAKEIAASLTTSVFRLMKLASRSALSVTVMRELARSFAALPIRVAARVGRCIGTDGVGDVQFVGRGQVAIEVDVDVVGQRGIRIAADECEEAARPQRRNPAQRFRLPRESLRSGSLQTNAPRRWASSTPGRLSVPCSPRR